MCADRASAKYGATTILVESNRLGGTCVKVGCKPKKLMWNAATISSQIKEAHAYDFSIDKHMIFDWASFKEKRDAFIQRLNKSQGETLSDDRVQYFNGVAQFKDSHTVKVTMANNDEVLISAKHFLIAVGGYPNTPSIEGADLGITSDDFFKLERQPRKVAVVGAGYIAVEMAGMLSSFGVETHMFIRQESFLRAFDPMIQERLLAQYEKMNIMVHKSSTPIKIEDLGNGRKRLHYRDASGDGHNDYDSILWAIGRLAATSNLNLTPAALAAGSSLADRLFGGKRDRKLDYSNIPSVVFAHPEVGSIGMTEPEARGRFDGENIKIYTSTFLDLYYATMEPREQIQSSYKLVCVGQSEQIVGLHIFGRGSSEILQGFAVAIRMGATKADLDNCVAIHPTSAEELVTMR